MSYRLADSTAAVPLLPPEDDGTRAGTKEGRGWRGEREEEEDMAEERTTDVAHYANVSRYVVQRKQTEPEAPPTPYTRHASRHYHPLISSPVA